jgi:hypothetical protein
MLRFTVFSLFYVRFSCLQRLSARATWRMRSEPERLWKVSCENIFAFGPYPLYQLCSATVVFTGFLLFSLLFSCLQCMFTHLFLTPVSTHLHLPVSDFMFAAHVRTSPLIPLCPSQKHFPKYQPKNRTALVPPPLFDYVLSHHYCYCYTVIAIVIFKGSPKFSRVLNKVHGYT